MVERERVVVLPGDGASVGTPFLARLTAPDRAEFLRAAIPRRFLRGATLFHQDVQAEALMVLSRGYARASHLTVDGKELILDVLGPGEVMGLIALTSGTTSLVSVRATTAGEALVLSSAAMYQLMHDSPSMAFAVVELIAGRLREAERSRVQLATMGALELISTRLIILARRWGIASPDGHEVTLHLTQSELAAWAGVSREAAVKALRTLRDMGLVTTARQRLTINDLAHLRSLVVLP